MDFTVFQKAFDWFTSELLAACVGGLLTLFTGLVVARWTFLRHRKSLQRGEFHGKLLVQSHLLLPGEGGREVLCFTTEKVYPNIGDIFPNPALKSLFLKRAALTTKDNPLIDLGGQADHAKRDIISHLSESIDSLQGRYLVLTTREAQDAVERKINRVFLIPPELLVRFREWNQARKFAVEVREHWPRILNLHLAARRVLDEEGNPRSDRTAFFGEIFFGERKALATVPVDWEKEGVEQRNGEGEARNAEKTETAK